MLWRIDVGSSEGIGVQIAALVRRGITSGEFAGGEQLPNAAELADVLAVNKNTVLAAYRALREEGLLQFRRGRGVRVAVDTEHDAALIAAVGELTRVAARHGYAGRGLRELLEQMGAI